MAFRNDKGRGGEESAARWLADRGWQIIGRNVPPPIRDGAAAELDIIAFKDKTLAFVEVKFHRQADRYYPLSTRQIKRIAAAADWYADSRPQFADCERRLDLALVRPDGSVEYREAALFVT